MIRAPYETACYLGVLSPEKPYKHPFVRMTELEFA